MSAVRSSPHQRSLLYARTNPRLTHPAAPSPHCRKEFKRSLRPSNLGHMSMRTAPSATLDNWAAAWKVRRHWEEQTEIRKAAGKVIY